MVSASALARGVLAGGAREVARAISRVEREDDAAAALIAEIFPSTGAARILGITGPPGAGKSTLVARLARRYRLDGKKVGIVAVDPTSPYSGGAILGDRIRMSDLYTDPGVFIRSMATRGALGGLSRATIDAVDILDAAGFDVILIETVGVGQDEVDIVRAADSIAVVLAPGQGDDIQAIKAGILEIADVFAVNKSDREGADRTAAELSSNLDFNDDSERWRPPIVKTVASRGTGVDELCEAFDRHLVHLESSGEAKRRRLARARARVLRILEGQFFRDIEGDARKPAGLEEAAASVSNRTIDPYAASRRLYERFRRHDQEA